MIEKIAERKLMVLDEVSGQSSEFVVQIGRPYWVEPGIDAVCPVRIEGGLEEEVNIFGVDELSALDLAIGFIKTYLLNLPPTKKVYWSDGEPYFD